MEIKEILFVSKVGIYSTNNAIQLKLKYKNKVDKIPLYRGVYSLDMELIYETILAAFINRTIGNFINNLEALKALEEIEVHLNCPI